MRTPKGLLRPIVIFMGIIFLLGFECGIVRCEEKATVEGTLTLVDANEHPLPNSGGVVVYLDQLEHPDPVIPPVIPVIIRHEQKQFIPAVLPIVAGTTVEFPNKDIIQHNVFSMSKSRPFDLGIYGPGSSKSVTFDRPGLVQIYCSIHPSMTAHILILANNHFTVADAKGHFTLGDVPLGGAIIKTWSPRSLQHLQQRVQVAPTGIKGLKLKLTQVTDAS